MLTVLTGANSGLGLETARALRAAGHDLILTVRTQSKAAETRKALEPLSHGRLDFVLMDLADMDSVRKAAEEIKSLAPAIDRLINNAGYTPGKIEFNRAGYEKSFAANHLGHFVLALALLDRLRASRDARIINLSSAAHYSGSLDRMFKKNDKSKNTLQAYCDGKLANVFFARGLAREFGPEGILSFSLHPGVVKTGFASGTWGFFRVVMWLARPFMISPEKGVQTTLYLATAPRGEVERYNGGYFDKSKPIRSDQPDLTIANDAVFWDKTVAAVAESMQ
jgi:NAD(P)-dependent dehydrogenase (short-subunit alcohol dehydrogenase family)